MKRLKSGSSGSRTGAILNKRIIYMKKDEGTSDFVATLAEIFNVSFEIQGRSFLRQMEIDSQVLLGRMIFHQHKFKENKE